MGPRMTKTLIIPGLDGWPASHGRHWVALGDRATHPVDNMAGGYGPGQGRLRVHDAPRAARARCTPGRTPSDFTLERRA